LKRKLSANTEKLHKALAQQPYMVGIFQGFSYTAYSAANNNFNWIQ